MSSACGAEVGYEVTDTVRSHAQCGVNIDFFAGKYANRRLAMSMFCTTAF